MRIAIDFDGVIVVSEYPSIGRLMTGAKETINQWCEDGHIITINTCRAEEHLEACKTFLSENGIKYHFINENDPALIKWYGMDTRKMSADVYIDDKNLGGFAGWEIAKRLIYDMVVRKPIIICIIGESGSGKTTLAEYIEGNFGVKMIESRTTRPPRHKNESGHTFVSDEEFDTYDVKDMLAFTKFGDYRYCCLRGDVRTENTYVIDEKGYEYLMDNFGDEYDISSIRVYCNKQERIRRVGEERVKRDNGMFFMHEDEFDYIWETDRNADREILDANILYFLKRGLL